MSTFTDGFKKIVGTLAPTIATALGGPFAGAAVSALTSALGLAPTTSQADLEKAVLNADPAALAQVKVAEVNLQATLASLGVQEEQLAYGDTDSARKREEEVKDRTPSILAYLLTVGFFGVTAFMLLNGKPQNGGDALLVMLGALGGGFAQVLSYYFGSSSSSKSKTDALTSLASTKKA